MSKINEKIVWKNKIVGHAEIPPADLLAHPENWRIHPQYQQEALRGAINDVGFIKSVTVNKRSGRVVDGHLRVTLALRDGIPLIPVEYVDLTEQEEAEALLTIDPIAALAGSDKDNLTALLAQVDTNDAAVLKLLEDTATEAGIMRGEPVDAEPQVDRAAELQAQWATASGQLWKLGDHRLLIGDCTVRENVERLMGGERADSCITDPPYGISYNPSGGDGVAKRGKYERVIGDEKDFDPISFLNFEYVVLWGANHFSSKLPNSSGWICWQKIGDGESSDTSDVELAWTNQNKPARRIKHIWRGMIRQDNDERFHATQKPVSVMAFCIENYKSKIIFEPFAGSGTTIIAAHNLNRRCYAMEISPAYGAVILQRFQDATGITPELVD